MRITWKDRSYLLFLLDITKKMTFQIALLMFVQSELLLKDLKLIDEIFLLTFIKSNDKNILDFPIKYKFHIVLMPFCLLTFCWFGLHGNNWC